MFFVNEYCGVSPALNVRLSDILMASIVEGTAGQTGAAYKLTLINPAMEIRPEQSTSAQSEEQVTVPYRLTGADIDNATWVSVLFTKKDILTVDGYYDAGEAIYIPNVGQDGKAVFSIPEEYRNKECGTDYHVYLIAENVNGEKETDYASKPVEIVYSKDHMVTVPQTGDAGELSGKMFAVCFILFCIWMRRGKISLHR